VIYNSEVKASKKEMNEVKERVLKQDEIQRKCRKREDLFKHSSDR
jgi:hypothetical protein